MIGASAWKKSTFAMVVWLSAVMNDAEEIAISAATASPGRPMARNARHGLPRSTTAT